MCYILKCLYPAHSQNRNRPVIDTKGPRFSVANTIVKFVKVTSPVKIVKKGETALPEYVTLAFVVVELDVKINAQPADGAIFALENEFPTILI
jgi:hypothetical protein